MLKESAFSKRLKDLRKKAGLKQVELADLSGIDPNLVSRYERGESMPTLETAQKLALSLGISIDYLLSEPDKQEFEVKILMGVKTLPNVAGIEITDNSFIYGVDDEKPQIHIGGMINIGTPQEREESLKKIIASFQKACWMFDHKDEAEAQIPDFNATVSAIQPA